MKFFTNFYETYKTNKFFRSLNRNVEKFIDIHMTLGIMEFYESLNAKLVSNFQNLMSRCKMVA